MLGFNRIKALADRTPNTARRATRGLKPTIDSLEARKMLSTATASAGGYFVQVFTRNFSPTDVDISANLYRNGSLVRSNITVANSTRNETAPTVSINASGRFAVAYVDRLNASDDDIKLRVFNGSGNALTSNLTVDGSTRRESDPDVSINGFGRIVVAYTQQFSTTDLDVKAVQFLPNTSTGSTYSTSFFTIANEGSRNEFDPYVTVAEDGDWAVSYTRRFSTTDLDVHAFVRRTTGTTNRVAIATSTANEDASNIVSFAGGSSLTVSYRKGLSRFQRTVTV